MERDKYEAEKNERRQEQNNDVLFIKETVVKKLLNWNNCVDAMESALVAMSSTPQEAANNKNESYASQNPRTLTVVGNNGILFTMPGYAANYTLNTVTGNERRHSTLACKLVTSFSGNSQLSTPLPSILATILLFDSETGKLKAIIDGTEITAWRTAAVSVVATKHLFYDENLSQRTLAILGTGTQVRNDINLLQKN